MTDQYYLRARYYNPSIGRFMQEDTFRGDGLNLYAYVANNPIKYIDPTGHCKEGINFSDANGNILIGNQNDIFRNMPGLDWTSDYFKNIDTLGTSQPNIQKTVDEDLDNSQNIGYSTDTLLGSLAKSLNVKIGEKATVAAIDLWAYKGKVELSVGEAASVSSKTGPFKVTAANSEIKVSRDTLDLGGVLINKSISAKWRDNEISLTNGTSISAVGYNYSESKTIGLKSTSVTKSLSTNPSNPSNGEPKVTLTVTVEGDNARTTIVAGVVLLGIFAPEALPMVGPKVAEQFMY